MIRSGRWSFAVCSAVTVVLLVAAPACAHTACPAEITMHARPRLDAALRERIVHDPEATVGVFVRTTRSPDDADRRALAGAGLEVGAVAGEIVTGRLRACDAVRVAALEFVHSIEMAHDVTRPPLSNVRQDP